MSNEKVSVVVPVYNVEDYLKRCIDSILHQTYKNIEIILVDDGATDKSGQICDEYARKDSRIRVVHQKNRGLSGARNTGIDIAAGEYITFIDSDDYVADNYIEELISILEEKGADISICLGLKFDGKFASIIDNEKKILEFTSEEAIEDMLYRKIVNSYAWGKLFKTSFWADIRFPEGALFEDVKTIYKLYDLADKIVMTNQYLYYYYQRTGSIVNSGFDKRKLDVVKAGIEIKKFVDKKYPKISDAAISKIFISSLDQYRKIPYGRRYQEEKKYLKSIIQKSRKKVLLDKNNKKIVRVIACMTCISTEGVRALCKCYTILNERFHIRLNKPL